MEFDYISETLTGIISLNLSFTRNVLFIITIKLMIKRCAQADTQTIADIFCLSQLKHRKFYFLFVSLQEISRQ